MILVENLKVTYQTPAGPVEALAGVSFTVGRGESCAVIGPSGCGKSTLLYVLAGLKQDFEGKVEVAGRKVEAGRTQTALILQHFGLLPWKNVWENVALGLKVRRFPSQEVERRVSFWLKNLGLYELRHLHPAQLSGGQCQRVAIARALVLQPDLLLMDEPFSSLDALTREALQETLLEIWQETRCTIVLVTHSIEEAVFLGQKVVVLSPRPGRVVAVYTHPLVGDKSWRHHPDFHLACTRIRQELSRANEGKVG
ncbi:ABC transporter related protein [Ammonifex degensii KC4]|uniref:ABC transporter related protein n=1 Tax=Ammonifex degensii (strain DSM 10501 / KC4) TaxID=429009 RepID=C9RB86_AMMDK|nr:ABC transporter ATP-binding protein [Ammonifex degensii]ACX51513.1 ABC transporter related protein [Ammonifex degensii KC4]